ncbi:MAG: hypothetical protein ACK4Z4_03690 [Ferrovibrio sp.]
MSIPTNTGNASISYEGDGITALFAIPFTFTAASEIAVYLNGSPAAGVTIYGAGDPFGGTAAFAAAPASSDVVRIRRLQTLHISSNDSTARALVEKLVAGAGIALTEINDGGDETLRIDVTSDLETCKVWVNFNGIGTVAIRDSFNVSSITDLGTGDYMVNYGTPFATVDYCAQFCSDWYTPMVRGDVYDVDKARVSNFGSITYQTYTDCKFGLFTAFGPQ